VGKIIGAILARVSSNLQDTKSQIKSLQTYAESLGYSIPEKYVFTENITGMDKFNKEERISLTNLKKAIEIKRDIECVFMWELTRLSRNPFFLIDQLRWFNEQKIPIYFYDIGKWTLNKDSKIEISDTTSYIFGAATYGQTELNKIRARTMRGREDKAKQGLFVGHISDGYKVEIINKEKHIVIDKEREDIVKRIFDLYTNKHLSTNKIAKVLNDDDVLTFNAYEAKLNLKNPKYNQVYRLRGTNIIKEKSKQKWRSSSIGQLLKNKWYIGMRTYMSEEYPVTPIINEQQFKVAQEYLKTNNKTIQNRRFVTYLLKGKFFCGKCLSRMNGHKVRINSSYYCSSLETGQKCGDEGICKQNIEAIIWGIVLTKVYAHHDELNLRDIFKISEINVKEYKIQINKNEKNISKKNKNIESGNNQISELYREKTSIDSIIAKKAIDVAIKNILKEGEDNRLEIEDLEKENDELKLRLKNNDNIDNIIFSIFIDDASGLEEKKDIIDKIINKVILYNLENNDKLIVIEYLSLKKSAVIYNSRTMRGCSIVLDALFNDNHISFDKASGRFINNHKCIITYSNTPDIITFDTEKEQLILDTIGAINEFCYITKSHFIDSDELKDMMSFFITPYARIEKEPKDEEYKKWREDYKRWSRIRSEKRKENRISYKPKKLEDPIQIAEIMNQRKNLYNQRYKAKISKILSEEQKAVKLKKIEESINRLNSKLNCTQ